MFCQFFLNVSNYQVLAVFATQTLQKDDMLHNYCFGWFLETSTFNYTNMFFPQQLHPLSLKCGFDYFLE